MACHLSQEGSHRTTYTTGASACSTSAACPGRGSGSSSADLVTTARTYTHGVADEREIDCAALLRT